MESSEGSSTTSATCRFSLFYKPSNHQKVPRSTSIRGMPDIKLDEHQVMLGELWWIDITSLYDLYVIYNSSRIFGPQQSWPPVFLEGSCRAAVERHVELCRETLSATSAGYLGQTSRGTKTPGNCCYTSLKVNGTNPKKWFRKRAQWSNGRCTIYFPGGYFFWYPNDPAIEALFLFARRQVVSPTKFCKHQGFKCGGVHAKLDKFDAFWGCTVGRVLAHGHQLVFGANASGISRAYDSKANGLMCLLGPQPQPSLLHGCVPWTGVTQRLWWNLCLKNLLLHSSICPLIFWFAWPFLGTVPTRCSEPLS